MKKQQFVLFLLSFLILAIIYFGVFNSQKAYNQNQIDTIEDNIRKAAVACYSAEGFYPDNVDYLKDNYGLVIDENKVNVFYQAVGSNILPDIMVRKK